MSGSKPNVILFGTGTGGQNGFKHLKRCCNILGFADNDRKKQGQQFMGLPVFAPSEIVAMDYDQIVICSVFHDEIQDQLNLQLDIPLENIDFLDPDIRNYGPGNPLGCLIFSIGVPAALGIAGWKIIAWLFSR